MYERMIIPLDGSEVAKSALPYARELAGKFGIQPLFLYVCDSHETSSADVYHAYIKNVAEEITDQSKKLQNSSGARHHSQPLKALGEVRTGHPAEEILRYADENKADLILMATHGRSGVKRWALGSVADKVLRSSTIPVWLIRAASPSNRTEAVKTIIVPLDGSPLAESVLPHVETLAKQGNAEVINIALIMVCETLTPTPMATLDIPVNWGTLVEEHMEYSKKVSRQYVNRIASRLTGAGLEVKTEILEGHPAHEIISYANKTTESIIAMATHGRSGLGRWAFGSTAEKILSGASHPILLIRPSKEDGPSLMQTFVGTVKSLPPI